MSYKPYPAYKDSGADWIGEMPEEWSTIKLKHLVQIKANQDVENRSHYLGLEHVESQTGKILGVSEEETQGQAIPFEIGDVLFGKLRPYLAKVTTPTFNGYCSTEFLVMNSGNSTINLYLKYLMLSPRFISLVNSSTYGTKMPRASWDFIGEIRAPKLTVVDSHRINSYLDNIIGNIESLIQQKHKKIKLLEEKRQAVITEAVTKGLDPNVPMKDSDIEWIGEIPAHWEMTRIKNLAMINPPKSAIKLDMDVDVSFIPLENIKRPGEIDYSLKRKMEDVYNGYTYFENNDIIMAKVTPSFENGNIAIVEEAINGIGFGTTEFHVFRTNHKVINYFLYYLLQTDLFKQKAVSEMYGVGGLQRIPTQFLKDFKIPLPNIDEQNRILQRTNEEIEIIDRLVEQENIVIRKLKEYRESLIYEAVTGKIDLRDYKGGEYDGD